MRLGISNCFSRKNSNVATYFVCINVNLLVLISAIFADDLPVTQQCLGCICEAISGCNTTNVCTGDVCGPFRITWAYWSDAGKPTVGGESPDSPTAYAHCAGDTYCAALCVQGYMSKFQQVRKSYLKML